MKTEKDLNKTIRAWLVMDKDGGALRSLWFEREYARAFQRKYEEHQKVVRVYIQFKKVVKKKKQ